MSTGPVDASVWREHGEPLVAGSGHGPLAGLRVAVKDLYAVAGHRVGAGNPTWLAAAQPETTTAPVVQALLDAGADVAGLAQTDELAYSLAGTNAHHGTPPNPAAPGRLPGGSSSGSATAVALGQADVGLGTDTGGSIRVPAAYQGLWGLRTTHGAVSRTGLLPLAPGFDAVGWLTRDAATLEAVGDVLLPTSAPPGATDLVVVGPLVDLAEDDVATAVLGWAEARGARTETWDLVDDLDLAGLLTAFQTWQGWQAWAEHGAWVADHPDALGADVRGRFATASRVTAEQAQAARGVLDAARVRVRELVGDRVVALPSASSVAPLLGADGDAVQAVRQATMQLTCLAGTAGLPAMGVPLRTAAGLPCGVCLVAAPGRDRDLLALARGGEAS